MAVKALNDSVDPDGLPPIPLVFGAFPRLGLPTDGVTPPTLDLVVALWKTSVTMSKHFASREVRQAMTTRNRPDLSKTHKTLIGHPVLVYRLVKDNWNGPFSPLKIRGEDIMKFSPEREAKFDSTVVKPYVTDRWEHEGEYVQINGAIRDSVEAHGPDSHFLSATHSLENRGRHIELSRATKYNVLMEQNVFTMVHALEPTGYRIYGSPFVNSIKNEVKPGAFEKSRLVVQANNDSEHGFHTHSATVQRVSQQFLLTFCAMDTFSNISLGTFHRLTWSVKLQLGFQYSSVLPLSWIILLDPSCVLSVHYIV